MKRSFSEVFENKDEIKLPESILDAFKGGDFDFRQCYNQERWICQMNQTFSCWLQASTHAEWNAFE